MPTPYPPSASSSHARPCSPIGLAAATPDRPASAGQNRALGRPSSSTGNEGDDELPYSSSDMWATNASAEEQRPTYPGSPGMPPLPSLDDVGADCVIPLAPRGLDVPPELAQIGAHVRQVKEWNSGEIWMNCEKG
ncbi:hypothetical protein T492DRAFT_837216 [Pavlovales sp. CCMP2436]|nr:hypothetical protein T492DRAFT_837216 [Pavlovales sp. CCMP2436]